ncbi:MAG: 30S ribosomal protein S12 methylthiotransferase RimO [bacterium]|nr:30S ribosomal protein S12 methylthiotransferase RimO [bacterium]
MRVALISLGCSKNQVDSELMLGILSREGYDLVETPAEAEVIIVNTCGFIESAKAESIEMILAAAQYKQANCRALIVAGCLSQRYSQELMEEMAEIDGMVGTGTFVTIGDVVSRTLKGERVNNIGEMIYRYDEELPRISKTPHSMYIKIADGCDNRCAYCAIPIVRGNFRSRGMDNIIQEVTKLAGQGVSEVIVVAQDTTRYGVDLYGEFALADLLTKLTAIEGPRWVRLLYCYPNHFTDEVIDIMAADNNIVKYIDIPLQHISDKILKAMNRKGTRAEIVALLSKIRERIPNVVIRTTFIVGFPGESQDDFDELKKFIETSKFDHVGVFKYSDEEDTAAHDMDGHVERDVMEARYNESMLLQQGISAKINKGYVGRKMEVLVEKAWPEGNGVVGRASKDAPEVDGQVYVKDLIAQVGVFVSVLIVDSTDYDLFGVAVL